MSRPFRVTWIGLRGIPGIQGGVETHAEQLCPKLQARGFELTVVARRPYLPKGSPTEYQGVRILPLWSPRNASLEAVVHSLLATLHAGLVSRPDILHIQAIGPALATPLARLLGLKVVVTHHGPDYDRQKWGTLAKWSLRLGERVGMRLAQRRIVISRGIEAAVARAHRVNCDVIPNGANVAAQVPPPGAELARLGLSARRYVVLVSRLVPEKRHLDLARAFLRANPPGWRLVFVGRADHESDYSRQVLETAAADAKGRIVCAGFLSGATLAEVFGNAGLFVLPSSHEGLPIALLEALSYGLPVLASNIEPNVEVGLPADCYFPLGDVEALSDALTRKISEGWTNKASDERKSFLRRHFDWESIADQTAKVYNKVLAGSSIAGITSS
ncbi:glycosyltransferase family 4 protein [Ideonella dechloratans]|uniref:glycosyltransferase family 4 protein n=1 Tax=Ideonella dechloratans TaxID=36863 RepID=UPI0035B2275B